MTKNPYSEANLVEQAALEVLATLGWQVATATEESFGPTGSLGRTSTREPFLLPALRTTLNRLNPDAPTQAVDAAIDQLTRDRSAMGLVAANRDVHRLLADGIKFDWTDPATGANETKTLRAVDWDHPEANDLLAVRQLKVQGPLYACIPDVMLFVNGLPWVVMEWKAHGVAVRDAFDDNLTSYKHPQNGAPGLFASNALLVVSNGSDAKVGSLTAEWDRFFDWKRIVSEDEPRRISLDVLLRGTCEPGRLFDLVRNFTLFSATKSGIAKILGQNHQFLGVNNAIRTTLEARAKGDGRAGVFWQTQGSGKSFAMVFYAQKILRTVPGNWTFVVVTDRAELDDQIAKTFAACGAVEDAKKCHAQSSAHLRQLLGENHRYVFTLIHKFTTTDVLCARKDVIVIADEAHRSQYDTLAMNMRSALPNALFVAFTGTPLIDGEDQRTRELFGDYVSIYDFQQSVEDNATVPLFYENRTPELKLDNPTLDDDLHAVLDAAMLDGAGEARLEQLLGQKYHLITRDDRLETVAKDIVQHFMGRTLLPGGRFGKAMVVSIDKATALRTHDKVRAHWTAELERVERRLAGAVGAEREELAAQHHRMRDFDMALIVSAGQNEVEDMKKLGLDILPHRRRLVEDEVGLDERFKDPADPLALVFVCAMWLTGFDAPSCTTVYLDKPMKNHTLMQTITRANRVFPGKHSGMIVDYANVFTSLERALAVYGAGGGRNAPAHDKSALVGQVAEALAAVETFCRGVGVDLASIERHGPSLARLEALLAATELLLHPEDRQKAFLLQAKLVERLFGALKPHPRAAGFAMRVATVVAIADKIRERTTPKLQDLDEVLREIDAVLDASISGPSIVREGGPKIDLSRIDFQALAKKFAQSKGRKNLELERLRAAIAAQIAKLIVVNPTRVDFRAKFEAMIAEYNTGAMQIDQLFAQLLELSRSLSNEEQRHVRENLTESELVVFDLLTRPGPELSPAERDEVKKVVKRLLARLQSLLSVEWQATNQGRARVKSAIEDELDQGLPRSYTPEVFTAKAGAVFQHVYETRGRSA
jgi:type I restriction enzyme R subunit